MEYIDLMKAAVHEIRRLRAINEKMRSELRVLEIFERLSYIRPPSENGMMGIDIGWQMERFIEEAEINKKPENKT
jgi:hypothetical protein